MNRPLRFAAAVLLTAAPVSAGSGVGTTGAPFLKIPINARAVGMAGAFTSIAADVTSLEYNPAGLADLRRNDISLTYIDYLEDTSLQSLGFALPINPSDEPALNGYFTPGKVVTGFQFRQFLASDEGRNDIGVKTGTIDIRDQLFHIGAAVPASESLAIGAGLKYISSKLDADSAAVFAGDVGVMWRGPRRVAVGASALNLGPGQKFENDTDPLPTILRLGASMPFGPVLGALDVSQGRDKVTRLAGGAELALGKFVKLRGGAFSQTSEVGFTAGLGVMVPGPMKSPPSAIRRGTPAAASKSSSSTSELAFNERRAADLLDRLNVLAGDLIERFHKSGLRPSDYPLAVLPATRAGDRMGSALADLMGQQLQQEFPITDGGRVEAAYRDLGSPEFMDDDQAARLGQILRARAVMVQQLTTGRDNYILTARIVSVDTGNSVASASATLPGDSFRGSKRDTLASAPARSADRPANAGGFNRVDWGLDYGFTSQDTLGVSHTISLRILY